MLPVYAAMSVCEFVSTYGGAMVVTLGWPMSLNDRDQRQAHIAHFAEQQYWAAEREPVCGPAGTSVPTYDARGVHTRHPRGGCARNSRPRRRQTAARGQGVPRPAGPGEPAGGVVAEFPCRSAVTRAVGLPRLPACPGQLAGADAAAPAAGSGTSPTGTRERPGKAHGTVGTPQASPARRRRAWAP